MRGAKRSQMLPVSQRGSSASGAVSSTHAGVLTIITDWSSRNQLPFPDPQHGCGDMGDCRKLNSVSIPDQSITSCSEPPASLST